MAKDATAKDTEMQRRFVLIYGRLSKTLNRFLLGLRFTVRV